MNSCITHTTLNSWSGISCCSSGLVLNHCTRWYWWVPSWCTCTGGCANCPSLLSPKYSAFWVGWNHSYSPTFTFLSQYILFISNVFFFQDFISSKRNFFVGWNLFTTLLAITRLLDFEVTTLPYSTRSWKPTTRWGLAGGTLVKICGQNMWKSENAEKYRSNRWRHIRQMAQTLAPEEYFIGSPGNLVAMLIAMPFNNLF